MTDREKLAVNTNEDAEVEAHARYTGNTNEEAEVDAHARGVNLNTNEDLAEDAGESTEE